MLLTVLFSLPVIVFTVTIIYHYNIITYNYNIIGLINNDVATLQDPILLLKIPLDTRKNFPGNYPQFGHAPSKSFASPGQVDCCMWLPDTRSSRGPASELWHSKNTGPPLFSCVLRMGRLRNKFKYPRDKCQSACLLFCRHPIYYVNNVICSLAFLQGISLRHTLSYLLYKPLTWGGCTFLLHRLAMLYLNSLYFCPLPPPTGLTFE
jgi:hypothetical protein